MRSLRPARLRTGPVCEPARVRRASTPLSAVAAIAVAAAILVSCGGGSRSLTASEFVDEVNGQGVSMRLGRQLQSGDGEHIYAITLPPLPGTPAPQPGHEGAGGATGSLYVYADTGPADERLEACRASAGLICFRASNVVVVLDEESGRLEVQRLAVAIERLE
jgi:hypothetical protein